MRIDDIITDPRTNADMARYDAVFAELRRDTPVRWIEPAGFRPFWVISRHADILAIERAADKFLNEPRTTLLSIDEEEQAEAFTGGGNKLVRMLTDMDGTDHRRHRLLAQSWFMPANLRRMEDGVRSLARSFVDRMEAAGGECDFVRDVASWYPLRVIMMILGVPEEDEPLMLRLTRDMLGAQDDEVAGGLSSGEKIVGSVREFFDYFRAFAAERRANPRDDIASILANADIGEHEMLSYYVIISTAGHDTTSGTIAGGLLALIQNPSEMAKLRADPALLDQAVDEMLRWVTPVKHFMRTAVSDQVVGGQLIRSGDSLMLCYPSANRDEAVFEDPYAFKVDRTPNKQLSFGSGVHLCLGMHLARMEIKAILQELLSRFDEIELAGEPAWLIASQVSCLKTLRIRYRTRERALA